MVVVRFRVSLAQCTAAAHRDFVGCSWLNARKDCRCLNPRDVSRVLGDAKHSLDNAICFGRSTVLNPLLMQKCSHTYPKSLPKKSPPFSELTMYSFGRAPSHIRQTFPRRDCCTRLLLQQKDPRGAGERARSGPLRSTKNYSSFSIVRSLVPFGIALWWPVAIEQSK